MSTGLRRSLAIWTGLWLAPLVWAANMQLGQILPYADCRLQVHWSAVASFGAAVLAAASGLASWLTSHRTPSVEARRDVDDFGRIVSALSAGIFTFALLMQGVAAIVLTGCEK